MIISSGGIPMSFVDNGTLRGYEKQANQIATLTTERDDLKKQVARLERQNKKIIDAISAERDGCPPEYSCNECPYPHNIKCGRHDRTNRWRDWLEESEAK